MYLVCELRWKSWEQEAGVEEGRVASASEEVCILAQFGTQDKDQNWVLRVVYLMKRGFHRVLKGKPWWGVVSLTGAFVSAPQRWHVCH